MGLFWQKVHNKYLLFYQVNVFKNYNQFMLIDYKLATEIKEIILFAMALYCNQFISYAIFEW